jgi:hypothetical protein
MRTTVKGEVEIQKRSKRIPTQSAKVNRVIIGGGVRARRGKLYFSSIIFI